MFRKHPVLTVVLLLLVVLMLAFGATGTAIMTFSTGSGEFDYLLVLGTTVEGTEPSSMLRDRIDAAYRYLTAHEDVICVVSGGKGDETNLSEAQCMYNELTVMGISPERIWMEDKAVSTVENFQFSLDLIQARTGSRPKTIGVLSSEFHLLRADMFARRQNVTAVTLPARTSDTGTFLSYFLREIVLVWYYAIFG